MLEEIREIRKAQVETGKEISALKVKAGIWGAAAGMVPVGLAVAVTYLKNKFHDQ